VFGYMTRVFGYMVRKLAQIWISVGGFSRIWMFCRGIKWTLG